MVETSREPDPAGHPFWSWLGFWLQFLILGLFVVIGAFTASECLGPGDYVIGMLLILGALVLAFLRLKHRFDGGSPSWGDFLFVDHMKSLTIAIPLFAVLGLIGLFTARSWPDGSLHNAGLGLFAVSGIVVFFDIKRVFDRMNSHSR
ncbi:MAG TPA: hypothetical protein VGR45_17680 [Stellaceae bacterium]|nr:hypothetical protein [Stellaceae bacterium]